jgi:hypothetical protein
MNKTTATETPAAAPTTTLVDVLAWLMGARVELHRLDRDEVVETVPSAAKNLVPRLVAFAAKNGFNIVNVRGGKIWL